MKYMPLGVLILGLTQLTWAAPARAQASLLKATFEHIPARNLKEPPAGLEETKFRFSTMSFVGQLPVVLGGRESVVIPGFRYRLTLPEEAAGPSSAAPSDFHDIMLTLTMAQQLSSSWFLSANVGAGVATNFSDFDSDHLRVNGAVLARLEVEPEFAVGFGLVFNYAFGDLLPLPALFVDWRPSPMFRVDVFVPRHALLALTFAESIEVGLRAQLDGNRFVIRESESAVVDNVKYSIMDAGLIAGARIAGPVWLTAYAGTTFRHRFEVFDIRNTKVIDLDMKPGLVARLGVDLRI